MYLSQGGVCPGFTDVAQHAWETKAVIPVHVGDEDVGDGSPADTGHGGLPTAALPTVHQQSLLCCAQRYARNIPGPGGGSCKQRMLNLNFDAVRCLTTWGRDGTCS